MYDFFDKLKERGRKLYIRLLRSEKSFRVNDVVAGANTPSEYAVVNYADRTLIRKMLQNLRGLRNGLDFGCGYGRLTMVLQEFCDGKVVGADINPELVKEARRVYGDSPIEFVVLKNGKIPYPDGFFDLTMTFTVLQHIQNPVPFVEEIKRLTSKWILVVENTSGGDVHCWARAIHEYEKLFQPFELVKTEKRPRLFIKRGGGEAMLFKKRNKTNEKMTKKIKISLTQKTTS